MNPDGVTEVSEEVARVILGAGKLYAANAPDTCPCGQPLHPCDRCSAPRCDWCWPGPDGCPGCEDAKWGRET